MVSSNFDLNIDKFDSNQNSNIIDLKGPVCDNEYDLNSDAFDFRPPGPVPVPDSPVQSVNLKPVYPVVPYVPQDSQGLQPGEDQTEPAEADDAVGDKSDTIQEMSS